MATTPSPPSETLAQDVDADLPAAGRKVSYEEFFEWAPDSRIAEWVDGEIIMPSPPRYGHQDISDFLTGVLRIYVQAFELGQAISAPFQVKLAPDLAGREPDILFIAPPHALKKEDPRLERPPDVAVEVVSPGNEATDREDKYQEYAVAGVREYWLIDGQRETAEFYRLIEPGQYELMFSGHSGVFHSEVIEGFSLEVAWLWQVPLPREELVALEIAGVEYAQEILMAAAKVLPAEELAVALPAVLGTLPANTVARVLPEVLTALPADLVADVLPWTLADLPADAVAQVLPEVLTALPAGLVADILPGALADLPADAVAQVLPEALTALPANTVAQVLPETLAALPADTVAQALPEALTALPADTVAQVLPEALTTLPADTVAQVLPETLAALPADTVAQVLPEALATLPVDLVADILPGTLAGLPTEAVAQALAMLPSDSLVEVLVALSESLPPSERAKLRDTLS